MIALLLQGIPEQTAVVTLAFVIARITIMWNKILKIGILLALLSYVLRLSSVPFGVHTILLIIILLIALTWLGKGDLSLSLIACLLSFLALAIFEFVCLTVLMWMLGVTTEILFSNLVMRIVVTEPQVILLFIAAFILNKLMKKRVE